MNSAVPGLERQHDGGCTLMINAKLTDMMIWSKAHFAELAPAKVGLGLDGHEQAATKVADCGCSGARELARVERSAS